MSYDLEDFNVDVDKLLAFVKRNPAIYDSNIKEYHNVEYITKLWEEIGQELNIPGIWSFYLTKSSFHV